MVTATTPSQTTVVIEGIPTDMIVQRFADRILVIVTQMGKVGTLIEAVIPDVTPLLPPPVSPANPLDIALPPPPSSIHLTPLLGNAPSEHLQILHSLYAAQVATLVWTSSTEGMMGGTRPAVVVGIALRPAPSANGEETLSEHERRIFQGVMAAIRGLL